MIKKISINKKLLLCLNMSIFLSCMVPSVAQAGFLDDLYSKAKDKFIAIKDGFAQNANALGNKIVSKAFVKKAAPFAVATAAMAAGVGAFLFKKSKVAPVAPIEQPLGLFAKLATRIGLLKKPAVAVVEIKPSLLFEALKKMGLAAKGTAGCAASAAAFTAKTVGSGIGFTVKNIAQGALRSTGTLCAGAAGIVGTGLLLFLAYKYGSKKLKELLKEFNEKATKRKEERAKKREEERETGGTAQTTDNANVNNANTQNNVATGTTKKPTLVDAIVDAVFNVEDTIDEKTDDAKRHVVNEIKAANDTLQDIVEKNKKELANGKEEKTEEVIVIEEDDEEKPALNGHDYKDIVRESAELAKTAKEVVQTTVDVEKKKVKGFLDNLRNNLEKKEENLNEELLNSDLDLNLINEDSELKEKYDNLKKLGKKEEPVENAEKNVQEQDFSEFSNNRINDIKGLANGYGKHYLKKTVATFVDKPVCKILNFIGNNGETVLRPTLNFVVGACERVEKTEKAIKGVWNAGANKVSNLVDRGESFARVDDFAERAAFDGVDMYDDSEEASYWGIPNFFKGLFGKKQEAQQGVKFKNE